MLLRDLSKMMTLDDVSSQKPAYLATIFAQGNGHFGMRASAPTDPESGGTIVNGFYESSPIQYGEKAFGYAENNQTAVLLPDLRRMTICNAEQKPFLANAPSSLKLDLATGQLRGVWLVQDAAGKQLELTVVSVLGQTLNQFAVIDYQLKSVDYTGLLTMSNHLAMPIFGAATDDPRQPRPIHTLVVDSTQPDANRETMRIKAPTSGQKITLKLKCEDGLDCVAPVVPGQVLTRTVIATVSPINHQASKKQVTAAALHADATAFWTDFWRQADIQIEGAPALNRALHFNLFQLVSSAGRDGVTNVAAKGVSGVGYEGHYFWDTEMYMLPFYTYATPKIARALLTYRYHVLPQAKKQARLVGVKDGALFSWRTINGEEASAYFPASTAQFHIDADIAYAVDRYMQVTGDEAFLHDYGLEIIAETAKFWLHFGAWTTIDGQQRFCFFDVTGPDEYSAMVNNNYYTNRMAKHNLSLAVDWGRRFPEEARQFGLDDATLTAMAKAAAAVALPFDKHLGINAQDDEAFKKPIWPFANTPKDKYPLLLHYHPLMLYRYQVNKQADTLLADYLFDDVPADQLKREYAYYEKITTHDSSLSRSIFSALAARMGDEKRAYDYFMDTARMDLIDLQGNATDGLHIANLGGSWLSVVTGFAGVRRRAGQLLIDNHLPKAWRRLVINLQYQGRHLRLTLTHGKTVVDLVEGAPLTVRIDGQEQQLKG